MKLPNFRVLTKISAQDIPYETDEQHERDFLALIDEQDKILESLMYKRDYKTEYLCHFFDSAFYDEMHTGMIIDDAVEYLATKEGIDLVEYENGNIGFVAYYGTNYNGFEILRDRYMEDEDYENL